MLFEVLDSLRDRLWKTLHVRERREPRFLQRGYARLVAKHLFRKYERGRPIALLVECVKQQFLATRSSGRVIWSAQSWTIASSFRPARSSARTKS